MMTTLDQIVLAVAVVQALAVALIAVTGFLFYGSYRRGRRTAQPALDRAKAISNTGQALAERARKDGMGAVNQVKGLVTVVRRRAETTVRLAKEIRPDAEGAAGEVRKQREAAIAATGHLGGLARSLSRVKTAAEKARAARNGE